MKNLSRSSIYIIILIALLSLWLTCLSFFKTQINLKWNEIGDALNIFTSLISSFSFVFLLMQVMEQQKEINETKKEARIQKKEDDDGRFEDLMIKMLSIAHGHIENIEIESLYYSKDKEGNYIHDNDVNLRPITSGYKSYSAIAFLSQLPIGQLETLLKYGKIGSFKKYLYTLKYLETLILERPTNKQKGYFDFLLTQINQSEVHLYKKLQEVKDDIPVFEKIFGNFPV